MSIDNDRKKFISRIRELMRENGEMSPTYLSRIAHCELHSVTKWLNGTFYPRFITLVTLSNHFLTTIDFILGRTENDTSSRLEKPFPFTDRLAKLMSEQHFSRSSLAKKLGIKTTTVSKWLNQVNMPETVNLIKLSNLFDVSIEYLIGFSNLEFVAS